MNAIAEPTILVIVGITGDLSHRKLLPAIEQIVKAKAAPEKFRIVGVTRREVSIADVLKGVQGGTDFLAQNLTMCQMDLAKTEDYKILKDHLESIEKEFGAKAQRLFYLSVPPQASRPVVELLGTVGLADSPHAKLLLEKPFGVDLISAQELILHTKKHFSEEQIYRIDHYLAKEMSQNLVVFRENNALFKNTWNKNFIESIAITASEDIGIEGRTTFYEQTGALRDVVQSHLLQLAALTLMETPKAGQFSEVPRRRLAALRQLHAPAQPVSQYARRGQYIGYTDEVGNPGSMVETFVNITLGSIDPKWEGVPIRLVAGKALAEKTTEICITYKRAHEYEANQLRIKLQPNEGVELSMWTKVPGYEWKVERHALDIAFKDHFPALPEAYEQVLVDAINSNHALFTSSEEVLEAWRILEPIQEAWGMTTNDLIAYKQGTMPKI
jgi:glucose-6-phosphate 1-dehydrogenase